ncbi:c-type cytochrome [Campylobacter ureolyticus]|uniref:c-type cytochrome n=1 Tax=Campylobacter ureolyticus TaxID=827 RepID=UPI00046A3915|nr:c-type cytochrome [Campylobacter ureolyticus]MCR8699291.1 c-type cytochrome [Campylobacter ureolyticus]QIX86882.1 c-type cytochrome [Campylobacter ureolyticus]STA70814.1 Uncharacterised protein [Campylobacter ureolyticus]
MKKLIILLFIINFIHAESFITDMEYGKMLYKNPRGIGCHKCHGLKGEGMVIASYKEFNKTSEEKIDKKLIAPRINNLNPQQLADGITSKKRSVMPSYFLTKDEIIVIYKYLKQSKK